MFPLKQRQEDKGTLGGNIIYIYSPIAKLFYIFQISQSKKCIPLDESRTTHKKNCQSVNLFCIFLSNVWIFLGMDGRFGF